MDFKENLKVFPLLTVDVVFDPGEGDRSFSAALAEPEQEGTRTLVAQQSLLPLLTDEAHDGAAHRQKTLRNTSPPRPADVVAKPQ